MPRIRQRPTGPYATARCGEPSPPELLAGIAQFNRGEFYEQHETIEHLWRRVDDDVRYLYQGILLVGVGFHHLRRGNRTGARIKLARGLELLAWFAPACQGVDVARLIADATPWLERIRTARPEDLPALTRLEAPRVWFAGDGDRGE